MKVPFTQFDIKYLGMSLSGERMFTVKLPPAQSSADAGSQLGFLESAIREKIARELYAEKTK